MARSYGLALAFFILTVLVVPGLLASGTAPRWAFIAVLLPLLLPVRKTEFTSAHAFGLLFIWYAAISVSWSHHYDGLDALVKLIVIAEAFWLGSKLDDIKPVIIGFGLGIWVSSIVCVFGIDVPTATGNVYVGLLVNSNILGETAGLVLVAAIVTRVWWLIPGILPAFIMAHCRGAFVAVACVLVHMVWRKSKISALVICAIGCVGVYLGSSSSVTERIQIWTDVLPHLSLMGTGLGSTFSVYPLYSSMDTLAMRPDHLHNDWLEYAFETGLPGIAFLIPWAWLATRRSGQPNCNLPFIALAIEACFGFPLHMPVTAILGGIVAGYSVRNRPSLRHDIHAWRISLLEGASRLRYQFGHRRVSGSKANFPA